MGLNYYEDVVVAYLRADRTIFVNTECCIQLNEAQNPDTSGPHWYCDAVAVDFRSKAVFLCEVSFAQPPTPLYTRLSGWNSFWPGVCDALVRDCHLPPDWPVRPWLFIPESQVQWLVARILALQQTGSLPNPRITPLEFVQPWRYTSWRRDGEQPKPATIPKGMQV